MLLHGSLNTLYTKQPKQNVSKFAQEVRVTSKPLGNDFEKIQIKDILLVFLYKASP